MPLTAGPSSALTETFNQKRKNFCYSVLALCAPAQPGACMDSEIRDRLFSTDERVLIVGHNSLLTAHSQIAGCDKCDPDNAQTLIDSVLDEITGNDQTRTTYFFTEFLPCPVCLEPIKEMDSVSWGGLEVGV